MGYYSKFELSASGDDEQIEKLEYYLFKKNRNDRWYGPFNAYFSENRDKTKWSNHKDELKELSKNFPDIFFELYREGEESGDVEKSYYKNGKIQVCPAKITFDEYDERKLI